MSEQLLTEQSLVALAAVIVLGIAAQWLAWRLGVASILLLLVVGFLAGPVSGLFLSRPFLDPDALLGPLLLPFVSLSVALILYEGGLSLRFAELREARVIIRRLVTIGAAVTWLISGLAAWLILGLDPALAVLLGAILIVSGPTVIVPLLRHIRPTGRIGAILKWEGIVIDPIGAILAVLVFEVILLPGVEEAASHAVAILLKTAVVGGGSGFLAGLALALVLRWFWVPDYLENAVSIMFVVGAYVASHRLQPESGLLAATVMGITLANQKLVGVRHIVEFKENLRVLLLSALFILLSARMTLADLGAIGDVGLVFLVVLMVVARPAAVFFSTLGTSINLRELLFLSVMAPRGIVAASVAAVFALRLQAQGHDGAEALVPMTFLVIVGTGTVSSLTAGWIAHRLKLADPSPQGLLLVGAHEWGRMIASALQEQGFRVLVVDTNRRNLRAARMGGLNTSRESILAEHLLDEIDLGGLGRLVAATPNDWVNILAVHRFLRIFGRGEVFQVPPRKSGEADVDPHRHLHGRWLFGEDFTWDEMARRVARGAVVKPTPLTDEFTGEDFREHYGDRAVPLFVVTASKRLLVVTADQPPEPGSGDTLISLVEDEEENGENEENAKAPTGEHEGGADDEEPR